MKCHNCGQENKDAAKACKKCSRELNIAPSWFPDARWHAKTLAVIYVLVAVFYYGLTMVLKTLPPPYKTRTVPIEMTPWLRAGEKHLPEEMLKSPPDPVFGTDTAAGQERH